MNWEDEPYVRIYTRDVPAYVRRVSWRARLLMSEVIRKADRSGIIDIGCDDPGAVASIIVGAQNDEAEVRALMQELLADGCLILRDNQIVVRNYIEAQTARQNDKLRQQQSRLARSAKALGQAVTATTTVTSSHPVSPDVTSSHPASPDVTSSHPSLASSSSSSSSTSLGERESTAHAHEAQPPPDPPKATEPAKTEASADPRGHFPPGVLPAWDAYRALEPDAKETPSIPESDQVDRALKREGGGEKGLRRLVNSMRGHKLDALVTAPDKAHLRTLKRLLEPEQITAGISRLQHRPGSQAPPGRLKSTVTMKTAAPYAAQLAEQRRRLEAARG